MVPNVWLEEEIGATKLGCCARYCLSGSGNHGFYLLVPQRGLEIVNTVDFSPVLCERIKERRLMGGEREVTNAGKKTQQLRNKRYTYVVKNMYSCYSMPAWAQHFDKRFEFIFKVGVSIIITYVFLLFP